MKSIFLGSFAVSSG